jgi:hypothetical protein
MMSKHDIAAKLMNLFNNLAPILRIQPFSKGAGPDDIAEQDSENTPLFGGHDRKCFSTRHGKVTGKAVVPSCCLRRALSGLLSYQEYLCERHLCLNSCSVRVNVDLDPRG